MKINTMIRGFATLALMAGLMILVLAMGSTKLVRVEGLVHTILFIGVFVFYAATSLILPNGRSRRR